MIERTVFHVDVGTMSKSKARRIIKEIKAKFMKTRSEGLGSKPY